MVKCTALWGVLFFAVLPRPLSSATLNFLVVEAVGEAGEGPSPASFESSALWEACLLDVFFEAGHVVSNSPILRLSGAAEFPGGADPGGEFPRELRPGLEDAVLGGADYLILALLSYPPGADPKTKPEGVNLRIYSLKPAGGGSFKGFVYEGGASLAPREDQPGGAAPENSRPAGGEAERAKGLIRGLIPRIKD